MDWRVLRSSVLPSESPQLIAERVLCVTQYTEAPIPLGYILTKLGVTAIESADPGFQFLLDPPTIYLDQGLEWRLKRFVAAQALGHLILSPLGRRVNGDDEASSEFARHLLMPVWAVYDVATRGRASLAAVASYFYSPEAEMQKQLDLLFK